MRQRDDLSRIRIPAAQPQGETFLENNVAPELAVPGDVGDAEASLAQSEADLASAQAQLSTTRAAYAAVGRWRFVAARQGEQAIEAWVNVPIIFKLQES